MKNAEWDMHGYRTGYKAMTSVHERSNVESMEFAGRFKICWHGRTHRINVFLAKHLNGASRYAIASGHNIIVEESTYLVDDEKVRVFIINHEAGHIVCGHTSLLSSLKRISTGIQEKLAHKKLTVHRDINEEYEADAYAYAQDPRGTMHALKKLYEIESTDIARMRAYQEFKVRYEHLGGDASGFVPAWLTEAVNSGLPDNIAMEFLELQERTLSQSMEETVRQAKDIMRKHGM